MPLPDTTGPARELPEPRLLPVPPPKHGRHRAPRRIPRGLFALCLLSIAGLALLPWLQVGDGKTVPPFALFLGRFHPVILHVPIGLIFLALILEHAHLRGLRQWIPQCRPRPRPF